jgi:hypothetical protein
VELPAELVERDPRILLSVHAPCLVGLRLQRGREELRDPDKDDSDDREHHEQLRKREAVLRIRDSPDMQPCVHQAMRRSLSMRSACPS